MNYHKRALNTCTPLWSLNHMIVYIGNIEKYRWFCEIFGGVMLGLCLSNGMATIALGLGLYTTLACTLLKMEHLKHACFSTFHAWKRPMHFPCMFQDILCMEYTCMHVSCMEAQKLATSMHFPCMKHAWTECILCIKHAWNTHESIKHVW